MNPGFTRAASISGCLRAPRRAQPGCRPRGSSAGPSHGSVMWSDQSHSDVAAGLHPLRQRFALEVMTHRYARDLRLRAAEGRAWPWH